MAFAGSASAFPIWKFNGAELKGSESIQGLAVVASLSIPGMTTTCKTTLYAMKISNSAGTGKGEVTKMDFDNCSTSDPHCTVDAIGGEKLPWPVHLATFVFKNYVIFEGVKIAIRYEGDECVLGETTVIVTGTAGGLYDNPTETFTFNPTNFKASKTALKALSTAIDWNAVFTTEATGPFAGQALTVG
jgi:hypothetical protein